MSRIPTTDEVAAQEAAEDARAGLAGRDPLDTDVPEVRAARLAQPLYEEALRRIGHPVRTYADVIADLDAASARAAAAERRAAAHVEAVRAAYADAGQLVHPAARP